MCGIYGYYSFDKLTETHVSELRKKRDTLTHRGPDQAGEYMDDNLYFGHRRLSIMDLSESGRQPMSHDKVLIMVNGEVYNFKDIRKQLEAVGYTFKSSSDSEVVLYAYYEWGVNKLADILDGMYAISIYDKAEKKIFLVCDRVGIKPTYYHFDREKKIFEFASELKAITSHNNDLIFNKEALLDFLIYRYIPAPKTAYEKIHKLMPASILKFDMEAFDININQYWSLNPVSIKVKEGDAIKTVQNLVTTSVQEQMMSDVPVGVLLSGGIDSSIISILAAQKSKNITGFSIGFNGDDNSEIPFAKMVSDLNGIDLKIKCFDPPFLDDFSQTMLEIHDEPFADASALPTATVCQFAREYVKVVLSGDGGDELFGGYRWYYKFQFVRNLQKKYSFFVWLLAMLRPVSQKSRKLDFLITRDPVVLYAKIRGAISCAKIKYWKKQLHIDSSYDPYWAYRRHYRDDLPPMKAAQYIDFHTYLPDDILVKVDRSSMRYSLECRPPFLSKRIIEYVFSLPEQMLYKNGDLKFFLKHSFKHILPSEILRRDKFGFSIRSKKWKKQIAEMGNSVQERILLEFLKENRP